MPNAAVSFLNALCDQTGMHIFERIFIHYFGSLVLLTFCTNVFKPDLQPNRMVQLLILTIFS
jgi:hypothetical protein